LLLNFFGFSATVETYAEGLMTAPVLERGRRNKRSFETDDEAVLRRYSEEMAAEHDSGNEDKADDQEETAPKHAGRAALSSLFDQPPNNAVPRRDREAGPEVGPWMSLDVLAMAIDAKLGAVERGLVGVRLTAENVDYDLGLVSCEISGMVAAPELSPRPAPAHVDVMMPIVA
jgi:hypothetical protein